MNYLEGVISVVLPGRAWSVLNYLEGVVSAELPRRAWSGLNYLDGRGQVSTT